MEFIYVLMIIAGFLVILFILSQLFGKKRVSPAEFQRQKRLLKPRCSEEELNRFMDFLKSYPGGYTRYKRGVIVYQDYLGKEKGDLKGIFFNIVAPNPNLHTYQKEEFRQLIISLGVSGIDERPEYEVRDSALKNTETDLDDRARKEVGNIGESIVRSRLAELSQQGYSVINGAKLKYGDTVKEFDHIVVCKEGVFVIETKAFGMSNGAAVYAALFIDKGDKWIIRKDNKNRDLNSPTQQVEEAKQHLQRIIRSCPVDIQAIVALSNDKLFVKQNIPLPYLVKKSEELTEAITSSKNYLSTGDIKLILHDIDESRIN